MKRLCIAVALAAPLAACGGQGQKPSDAAASPLAAASTPAPEATPEGTCDTRAERDWEAGGQHYTLTGVTEGAICNIAVATLTIRSADGKSIYAWSGAVRDLFGLKDAADADAMKTALADWIDPSHTLYADTAKLPAWDQTSDQPGADEFPFHPDFDKAGWDALHARTNPVFCFVQGSESQRCVVLDGGSIEEIGLQQFPG